GVGAVRSAGHEQPHPLLEYLVVYRGAIRREHEQTPTSHVARRGADDGEVAWTAGHEADRNRFAEAEVTERALKGHRAVQRVSPHRRLADQHRAAPGPAGDDRDARYRCRELGKRRSALIPDRDSIVLQRDDPCRRGARARPGEDEASRIACQPPP